MCTSRPRVPDVQTGSDPRKAPDIPQFAPRIQSESFRPAAPGTQGRQVGVGDLHRGLTRAPRIR